MNSERARELEATRRRAREAYDLGEAALAANDVAAAGRWLERAHRLARADRTVALALALVRLRQNDPTAAAALLQPVVRETGRHDAILSLAIARRQQGLLSDAAFLLHETLGRHTIDPADETILRVADGITAESGAAAWSGLAADGRVLLRPAGRGLDFAVFLDGVHVGGGGLSGGRALVALPDGWQSGRHIEIQARGPGGLRRVLGGSIDLRAVLRVDGIVEPDGQGGLAGWARHPNAPGLDPALTVRTLAGRALLPLRPAAETGRFAVPADRLPAGPVRIVVASGRDLLGSPLDPLLERRATEALAAIALGNTARGRLAAAARFLPIQADWTGELVLPTAASSRRPGIAVVLPVHGGLGRTLACLDTLSATLPRGVPIHVVDDGSPEPALVAALDESARAGRIVLHRHPGGRNRGFPASANLGFVAAAGRDVVLLNSDTLLAGDWLPRLRRAAYEAPDIGTVTPLTGEGSIFGYPKPRHPNDMPDAAGTARLQGAAARANDGRTVDVPTGNGFCMFIRRACLDAAGLFREDLFAQGYGEENDFCLRARHAGWRHVAALDVYVAHAGATSFGALSTTAGRDALMTRNLAILNRLHPGYDALIARFIAGDPLAPARRRIDRERLRAAEDARPAVLVVTHQAGGGVERFIRTRRRLLEAEGFRPILLRGDPEGERTDLCLVEPNGRTDLPNLRYVLPVENDLLLDLLLSLRPARIEIHHLLGHERSITALCRRLALPVDVWVHDWAWFCPRISLLGPAATYCGEPPVEGCRRCIAEAGSHLGDELTVDEVIAESAALLGGAQRVITATEDGATRLRAHFPGLTAVEVSPWEPPPARLPDPPAPRPLTPERPLTVAVVGAIGPEKGVELLIACARDATARALPLRFVVVGHTSADDRLLATGSAFVTGPYDEDETELLIRNQKADLAFLPAIWPETWCFTLSECWRAGLFTIALDIGAPAERIRRSGGGALVPLGTLPASINDQLVAFVQQRTALVSGGRPSRRPSRPVATPGLVTAPQSEPWVPRAPATRRARTMSRQQAD